MVISFRQWLAKFTQNAPAQSSNGMPEIPEIVPDAVDPVEAEAAGLNFQTAIVSHQSWKARFKAMIESGIAEALNPNVVAQEDQCAVGKWIHGIAKAQFGDHPLWEKLRGDHAFFHTCASRVLAMIIRGEKQKALQEITSGAYARASNDVVMDLAMFYKIIRGN